MRHPPAIPYRLKRMQAPLIMRIFPSLFLILLFLVGVAPLMATHITGAELTYECISPATNTYKVTVTVYRDCVNGQAGFDNNIRLFVFRNINKTLYQSFNVPLNQTGVQIIPVFWNACTGIPNNVCVEFVKYTTNITLPGFAGGFTVGWARCCRNNIVTNVPPNQGITVIGNIPGPEAGTCNNMPIFNSVPPIFLCNGQLFNFDHSATDPDGDSLVYQIVPPFTGTNTQGAGATQFNPVVSVGGFNANPMGPPPYANVGFSPGFSFQNPFGSGNFSIDPQSGLLSLTPTQTGLSVFAVSVKEYRNGVLIGENIRDFQITVIDCVPQGTPPVIATNPPPIPGANPDTIWAEVLEQVCYNVTLSDPDPSATVQLFPASASFGIGGTFQAPLATFSQAGTNPAVGTVCWTPSCEYAGQTIRMVVGGRDTADCPGYNVVFDTVWIVVAPINDPTISHMFANGSTADTITLNPNQGMCVTVTGQDLDVLDSLALIPLAGPLSGLGGTATFLPIQTVNPVSASLCWTPPCNLAGQTLSFVIQVRDVNRCQSSANDTITVIISPLQPVGAGGDATICSGLGTPLNSFGGVSYAWIPATGLSNPNIANPIASPTTSTLYTVAITDAFDCVRTESVQVNVNPLPIVDAGPDVTRCPGATIPLQATGGTTYAWTPATGLSNPAIANPLATPLVNTTYTVTATDLNGCANSDQVTVTVMQAEAGTGGAICFGDSLPLSASGGISYSWTPAIGLSDPAIANPVAAPPVATTYTVTVTDASGCVDTDLVIVNILALPVAEAGPAVALCLGDSLQLTASGGVSYAWSPSPFLLGNTLASPVVFPDINTTFTVLVTDANGCVATDNVLVSVLALPIAEAGNDTAKCGEVGVPLSASGGVAYQWFPVAGLSDPTSPNPVANPFASQFYSVIVTDGNGCSSLDSAFVRVMYADAGPDFALCIGDSALIQASGGIAYQWQASPDLASLGTASTLAFPTVTSDFIVTVTDTSGCTDTDTIRMTVNSLPVTSTFGSDPYVCSGGGTVVNATGGNQFVWSPGFVFNDSTLASPIASPTYSGATLDSTWRLFVTVIDSNGCVNYDSLDQIVRVLPIIQVSNDTVNCPGGSVPLFANGGIAYSWSPAIALSATNTANVLASPDTTTTYTVRIEAVWGCADSADILVIVMEPEAGPDGVICLEDNFQLQGSGGTSYLWSPAVGLSDPSIATPMASPAGTTTYLLTVTDSLGCVDTDMVTITVNPLPPADAGLDQEMCIGDTAQLFAAGGLDYQWQVVDSLSSPGTASTLAWPTQTTFYPVAVVDGNGCVELDSMLLTVHPLPNPDAGADQTQCGEDSVTLLATGGVLYQWSPALGLENTASALTQAAPDSTTRYFVTVTDQFGCVNTDSVLIRTMYAFAGPEIITCPEDSVQLLAGSIGGLPSTFSWSPVLGLGDLNLAEPRALPGVTTTYLVTVTDTSGCMDTASQLVTVFPVPLANAGPDTEICMGDTLQLTASGGMNYLWDLETSLSEVRIADPLAYPLSTTTYRVLVTDGNGCQLDDEVEIVVNPLPLVDAGTDTTICGRGLAFLRATGASTYLWSPATSLDQPTSPAPVAQPVSDQRYHVIGTDLKGCRNTDSVFVSVRTIPTLSGDQFYEICLGQSTILHVDGADGYRWSTGELLPFIEVDPEFSSDYWVVPLGPTGCEGDRLDIQVYVERSLPQASISPSISEGFYPLEVTFVNDSRFASQYEWQFGDGASSADPNPLHRYDQPGQYAVTLIADNDIGCPDTTTYRFIEALDFVAYFPNAFSPNGDGENDEFRLVIQSFEQTNFRVYDRWGREVYQTNQADIRWDGTRNGVPVGEGVYVYTFRGVTYLGEVIERNGSITLFR